MSTPSRRQESGCVTSHTAPTQGSVPNRPTTTAGSETWPSMRSTWLGTRRPCGRSGTAISPSAASRRLSSFHAMSGAYVFPRFASRTSVTNSGSGALAWRFRCQAVGRGRSTKASARHSGGRAGMDCSRPAQRIQPAASSACSSTIRWPPSGAASAACRRVGATGAAHRNAYVKDQENDRRPGSSEPG